MPATDSAKMAAAQSGDGMETGGGAAGDAGLFPTSERVFYEKAPLVEVICQLRFPPILAIQAAPPAAFQETIRDTFPLMQDEPGTAFPSGIDIPPEMRQLLGGGGPTYKFSTEDGLQTVTLVRESLAYSTKAYTLWEDFKKILSIPVQALLSLHKPSFYTRIGLRYVDAINLENIELVGVPWSELFRKEILGELAMRQFEENLILCSRQLRMRVPEANGALLLQHGLANVSGKTGLSYVIDFDFYTDSKTDVGDGEDVLERFHDIAGRAFRWCITERLHHALTPRPLEAAGRRRSILAKSAG